MQPMTKAGSHEKENSFEVRCQDVTYIHVISSNALQYCIKQRQRIYSYYTHEPNSSSHSSILQQVVLIVMHSMARAHIYPSPIGEPVTLCLLLPQGNYTALKACTGFLA